MSENLPESWNERTLGEVASVTMGQSPPSESYTDTDEKGLPFFQGCGDFGGRSPKPNIFCVTPLKIAEKDAILVSVRAPVGTMNRADRKSCIGRGLAAIKGARADTDFLSYSINLFRPALSRVAQGTTFEAIGSTELNGLKLPIPPLPTQKRIAAVLRTVDEVIEATEARIEKQQAIKQGLLHDLFTRGVTPEGNLRPPPSQRPDLYQESELGLIPKEWEAVTLASQTERITSGSRGWAEYYSDEGALFIRIGNLTRAHPNFRWKSIQKVAPPRGTEGSRTRVQAGDILISITADLGIIGVAHEDLGEAYVNQHIALARPRNESIDPRFIGHFLGTEKAQDQFLGSNDSGAKAGLSLTSVRNVQLPCPNDSDEATAIAHRLDQADLRVEVAQSKLAKLRQLKSALMQDLLTGRVPADAIEID